MNKRFRVPGRLSTKLEELGVRVSEVLRRAGLSQDLFQQTRILVSTGEFFALWRSIGEVSGDPAISLRLATETRPERFDPMGIAVLSTENFGAAIHHLARYKKLTCPEEIVQHTDKTEWSIQFNWLLALGIEPPTLTEHCFAWVQTIGRLGTGTNLSPVRLEFMQPRSHTRVIERHFGCSVISGASRNAIVFRAADAQAPFVTRNAELLDMLVPQFDQELKQLRQGEEDQENFPERVRRAIQEKLTGHRPSIDDIARRLHMSSRTLQRRLQESGSNFQRVLDEARHQMARYYLSSSVLELNEAAYLLGYEDANSFVRAFRIWEGVPPGLWRESYRAKAILQEEVQDKVIQ